MTVDSTSEKGATGNRIVGNTMLNLGGYMVPMVVGLVTVPPMLHLLGPARFGALMLVFTALGYLTPLDLGIGRAATRSFAEAVGRGERERLSAIAWTSISFLFLIGIVGGLVFAAFVPLIVDRLLTVPPELRLEVKTSFFIAAGSLPFLTVAAAVKGFLEAVQRFDLSNFVKVISSTARYAVPLAALYAGTGLTGAVAVLATIMVMTVLFNCLVDLVVIPELRYFSIRWSFIRDQLSFGLWSSLSGAAILGNNYMDRTLVGSLLGLSAVTWYSAPQELASRLLVIPTSIVVTLFPIFSAGGCDSRSVRIHTRSVKSLILIMAPPCAFLILFARDVLGAWLGRQTALHSTLTLQLLSAGMFINAVGFPTYTFLHGIGRPELPTKFFLFELPVFGALIYGALRLFGLGGAAGVFLLRSGAELGWYWFALRRLEAGIWQGATALIRPFLCSVILFGAVAICSVLPMTFPARVGVFVVTLLAYSCVVKIWVLEAGDNAICDSLYQRFRKAAFSRLAFLGSML
jgi:O-antigen/teichoic acid export membrane protein